MRKLLIAIAVLTCFTAFRLIDNGKSFKKLYKLEGTWKMNTKRGTICEEWKKIN